jgi:hypothetical protein
MADDRSIANLGGPVQDGFELGRLNAFSIDLDLPIFAGDNLQ